MLYDDRLEGKISASRFDLKDAENRKELELVEENTSSLDSSFPEDPLEYAKGIIELLTA